MRVYDYTMGKRFGMQNMFFNVSDYLTNLTDSRGEFTPFSPSSLLPRIELSSVTHTRDGTLILFIRHSSHTVVQY